MKEIICKNLCVSFPIINKFFLLNKKKVTKKKLSNFTVKALDCVNITIKKGDRVGLLGRNGSGKSTFLRSLAGVYIPDSGILTINSPVESLFELNVGTDEDATGYENIPLLMASRQIEMSKYDEVVKDIEDFTELGDALNRPLRTYSQGMKLRIAFAIATFKQNNQILLMDEVINVGDKQFRKKSDNRIKKMMNKAGSLVLASHSAAILKTHCSRGIIFEEGKKIFDGSINEAINYEI
tara:strand:- start:43 stop:756 length:714 start_codon:yes stop_codon:yes gene_type:complete